jgi:hypothetical protein
MQAIYRSTVFFPLRMFLTMRLTHLQTAPAAKHIKKSMPWSTVMAIPNYNGPGLNERYNILKQQHRLHDDGYPDGGFVPPTFLCHNNSRK